MIVLEYTTGRMREVTRSVCSADSSAPAGMAQSPAPGRLRCCGLGAERPAGVGAELLEGCGGAGQSWRPQGSLTACAALLLSDVSTSRKQERAPQSCVLFSAERSKPSGKLMWAPPQWALLFLWLAA